MIEKIVSGSFFTNTYIISKGNDCIIIDPTLNFEKYANDIKNKYNVKAILLTHTHLDHIDGIRYFKDVDIYLSSIDYNNLNDDDYTLYSFFNNKHIFDLSGFKFNTVFDGDVIELLNNKIYVINTPGHTSGGVSYKFNDVIFTGDTLFKNSIGRTDFPTGNEIDILKSVKKIIDSYDDNIKLYPGHDEMTTIRDERKNNLYYKEAKRRF